MKYESPLRYPGGKASFAVFLAEIIKANGLSGCPYYEPYAGGAGAALHLLRQGVVSELFLNDLDHRITSFWRAVLDEPDRFANRILSIPLTIAEWRRQHKICRDGCTSEAFDIGFSTFYLNRCNRSGIIMGAAPIGGYAQAGEWRMEARFYRQTLADRVLAIARQRDQIHISNIDALRFLAMSLPRGRARKNTFAYLDPPYHANGDRLYLNSYNDRNHQKLACYMQGQNDLNWVMSYDDVGFIRDIYAACTVSHLSIRYSLQRKHRTKELLIMPPHVQLPASDAPNETTLRSVTST